MPINSTVHFSSWGKAWAALLVLGMVAMGMTGCSTPETRSKEKDRASAFESLSQADQRLVLKGNIREGLGEDAVYVAMGHPTRRIRSQWEGKAQVSWIYSRMETRTIPAYSSRVVRMSDGRRYVQDVYSPIYDSYLVDAFEVTFRDGKVIGWREL